MRKELSLRKGDPPACVNGVVSLSIGPNKPVSTDDVLCVEVPSNVTVLREATVLDMKRRWGENCLNGVQQRDRPSAETRVRRIGLVPEERVLVDGDIDIRVSEVESNGCLRVKIVVEGPDIVLET